MTNSERSSARGEMRSPSGVKIPDYFEDAVRTGEVKEIIYVDRIKTKGKPRYQLPPCGRCNEPTHYTRGPFYDLSNGSLLIVSDVWAYRCTNGACNSAEAALVFLPEVSNELGQVIQETRPEKIP